MTAPDKRTLGRPVTSPAPRKPHPVLLSEAEAATARRLGDGNLSEGVRRAITARQKFPIDSTADVV